MLSTATPTVSDLRIRGPSPTGMNPFPCAAEISPSQKPPSGPTRKRNFLESLSISPILSFKEISSFSQRISFTRSRPAHSRIELKSRIASILGGTVRPHCLADSTTILFQRFHLLSNLSPPNFGMVLDEMNGKIAETPISVVFCNT